MKRFKGFSKGHIVSNKARRLVDKFFGLDGLPYFVCCPLGCPAQIYKFVDFKKAHDLSLTDFDLLRRFVEFLFASSDHYLTALQAAFGKLTCKSLIDYN